MYVIIILFILPDSTTIIENNNGMSYINYYDQLHLLYHMNENNTTMQDECQDWVNQNG